MSERSEFRKLRERLFKTVYYISIYVVCRHLKMSQHVPKIPLRCRRIFLTYPSHIDKSKILQFLSFIRDLSLYRIWHETSYENDPTGYKHTHILLRFSKQPNYRDVTQLFDYAAEGGNLIHPNIKFVCTDSHWSNVCTYNKDKSSKDGVIYSKADSDPLQNFESSTTSTVSLQINSILGKRSLRDVMLDDDTSGIYKERRHWCKEIFLSKRRDRSKAPQLFCRWGQARVGKTRFFWDKYEETGLDTVSISGMRFVQGYKGNKVVLFDDFDPTSCPPELFLKLTDRYPFTIDTKGAEAEWRPDIICFTSNTDPNGWYDGHPDWIKAYRGRGMIVTNCNRGL